MGGITRLLFALLAVAGAVIFLQTLKTDPQRAWVNYLVGYFFWLCIGLSGVFFAALQHLTGSVWSAPVRRIAEVFTAYLPAAVVLFLILLIGAPHLFEWMHKDVMATDALLQLKQSYLNKPFFIVRSLFLFALCFILGGKMICNSFKQDETGDVGLTKMNVKLSAPFLLIFAWAFTFVAVDLIMSLTPHWFSTIFGVYCWAGLFFSGLAMLAQWVIILKRKGVLEGFVNENHLHDLGKLMFAFMVFWSYVAFSQFMLIWYANLPEENFFFVKRVNGPWLVVSQALMVCKFFLPLFMLVSRPAKRSYGFMFFMTFWFFAVQFLDLYWLVFPTFFDKPVFGFQEVAIFLGFGGIFYLLVGMKLSKVNPVAIKDPYLEQALHHHQ